jgi:hypothetical protein
MKPIFVAATLIFILAVPAPAAAQDVKHNGQGFFLSFSVHSLDFKGDFDKDLTLWCFEKAFFIPRMGKGVGLAIGIGYKHDSSFWDLTYLTSTQKAQVQGRDGTATYHSAEISGRLFLLKNFPLQPYLLGGISLTWVTVGNGAQLFGSVLDATYTGAGLNFGAGMILNLGPKLFIGGGVIYRLIKFLYAFGEGKGRDINDLRIGHDGPKLGRLLEAPCLGVAASVGFIL